MTELRWDVSFTWLIVVLLLTQDQIFESGWTEDQWQYPPVVGEKGYIGSATSYIEAGKEWQFDPATMDANATYPFPVRSLGRTYPFIVGYYEFWWLGGLADGSQIPSGNYT